jgi:hypothetical protein
VLKRVRPLSALIVLRDQGQHTSTSDLAKSRSPVIVEGLHCGSVYFLPA